MQNKQRVNWKTPGKSRLVARISEKVEFGNESTQGRHSIAEDAK